MGASAARAAGRRGSASSVVISVSRRARRVTGSRSTSACARSLARLFAGIGNPCRGVSTRRLVPAEAAGRAESGPTVLCHGDGTTSHSDNAPALRPTTVTMTRPGELSIQPIRSVGRQIQVTVWSDDGASAGRGHEVCASSARACPIQRSGPAPPPDGFVASASTSSGGRFEFGQLETKTTIMDVKHTDLKHVVGKHKHFQKQDNASPLVTPITACVQAA